eukprot:504891-Prymnesium_polylepis.1
MVSLECITCELSGEIARSTVDQLIIPKLTASQGLGRWLVKCTHAPEMKSSRWGEFTKLPEQYWANIQRIFGYVCLNVRGRKIEYSRILGIGIPQYDGRVPWRGGRPSDSR